MGDVAMMVPVIQSLLTAYPDVKITLVSRKFFKPLFQQIPQIHFFEADVNGRHKGILGLTKLAKDCKQLDIDAVADLHNVIRSKVVSALLKTSGIPVSTLDKGRPEKKALMNAKGVEINPLKTTHERYADVFRNMGFRFELSSENLLKRLPLEPSILDMIGSSKKKRIGIAPFAAFEGKMYPERAMKEVISLLENTAQYSILLFGGGKNESQKLQTWADSFSNVINVAGKFSFKEELALISNLDVMLSMDSGNGHLAANFNVPVITLWGVTHPYAGFVPFNQPTENQLCSSRTQYPLIPTSAYGNKVPEGYENVMESITPNTIVERLVQILR